MDLDLIALEAAVDLDAPAAQVLLGARGPAFAAVGTWGAMPVAGTDGRRSLATPLGLNGVVVGAIEVHRESRSAWPSQGLGVLGPLAEDAVAAARALRSANRQERQLAGIEHSGIRLRRQSHEHANRIHAIVGLSALGDTDEARRFVAELLDDEHSDLQQRVRGITDPTLAGLLSAEMESARREGVLIEVDPDSRVPRLPPAPEPAGWATLIGALIELGLEGAATVRHGTRRIDFHAVVDGAGLVLTCRDQGPPHVVHSVAAGLLFEAAGAMGGTASVGPGPPGTVATVRIPA
ncbi:MAG: hypothetical protein ABW026_18955 [Microvirga sp.]